MNRPKLDFSTKFWQKYRHRVQAVSYDVVGETQSSLVCNMLYLTLLVILCSKIQFGTIRTHVRTVLVAKRLWFSPGSISLWELTHMNRKKVSTTQAMTFYKTVCSSAFRAHAC